MKTVEYKEWGEKENCPLGEIQVSEKEEDNSKASRQ